MVTDDVTGAGTLPNLKTWWETILYQGAKIAYHVNQRKSWLMLKDRRHLEIAKDVFKDSEIKITTK